MSGPASTSDETKRLVVDLFDRLAPVYATVTGVFDHFGARLVDRAGIEPGMRVLDLAAGKGASAHPARDRGAEVVPVDLSPGMVEHLRADGFDARVMDAEHLDFPDHSFDAVLCGFGLFFLPDGAAGAREMKRVVKPGGPVACSMPLQFVPDYIVALRTEVAPKAKGPDIPGPNPGFDGAGVLRAGGFEHVETVDEAYDHTFASAAAVWDFCLSTGVREFMQRLDPEDAADLQRRALAAAEGPVPVRMSARFWVTRG